MPGCGRSVHARVWYRVVYARVGVVQGGICPGGICPGVHGGYTPWYTPSLLYTLGTPSSHHTHPLHAEAGNGDAAAQRRGSGLKTGDN